MDKIYQYILHANDCFWKFFYTSSRNLCDNAWFLVIIFAAVWAVLTAVFSICIRKQTVFPALLGLAGLWSTDAMLRHLPLLHHRLKTALATASGIVMQSESYKMSFHRLTGTMPESASDIVYYLWYASEKQWEKLIKLPPAMLYEKVHTAFFEERFCLFGYIDSRMPMKHIIMLLIGISFFCYILLYYRKKQYAALFILLYAGVIFGRIGTMLYSIVFFFMYFWTLKFKDLIFHIKSKAANS